MVCAWAKTTQKLPRIRSFFIDVLRHVARRGPITLVGAREIPEGGEWGFDLLTSSSYQETRGSRPEDAECWVAARAGSRPCERPGQRLRPDARQAVGMNALRDA